MTRHIIFFSLFLCFGLWSCEIDEVIDPNNPSINSVANDATRTQLNLLVSGIESDIRAGYNTYVTSSGTLARELWRFDADPRNTEDLLGKDDLTIDNNTFYLTAVYNNVYGTVKTCNILLEALENTDNVTAAEKEGYRGFANTMKGHLLTRALNFLGTNGIRVDVADPENLGPFLAPEDAWNEIQALLDTGFDQLQGSQFAFDLSVGFDGFDTPATFAQFNRAIAARVAILDEEYDRVPALLTASFFDLRGDLSVGPKHVYSTSSGDVLNPLFKIPDQSGDQIVVHPFISDQRIPGDTRFEEKFLLGAVPFERDNLIGFYSIGLYESTTSSIDIIRNEELVLIQAEAAIQANDFGTATEAIDRIRTEFGMDPYAGPETREALIDELLLQRAFSLWGEGHRMFDLRRYGRQNDQFLPIDRPGDDVFFEFPVPLTEL